MAEEHNLNIRARLDTSDIQAKLKNLNTNNPANGSTSSLSLNNVLLQLNNTLRSLQIAIRQMQARTRQNLVPQPSNALRQPNVATAAAPRSSVQPPYIPSSSTYKERLAKPLGKLQNALVLSRNNEIEKILNAAYKNEAVWSNIRNKLDNSQSFPNDRVLNAFKHQQFNKAAFGQSYAEYKQNYDLAFPTKNKRPPLMSRPVVAWLGANLVTGPMLKGADLAEAYGYNTLAQGMRFGSNVFQGGLQGFALGHTVGHGGAGLAIGVGAAITESLMEWRVNQLKELEDATKKLTKSMELASAFFENVQSKEEMYKFNKYIKDFNKAPNIIELNEKIAAAEKQFKLDKAIELQAGIDLTAAQEWDQKSIKDSAEAKAERADFINKKLKEYERAHKQYETSRSNLEELVAVRDAFNENRTLKLREYDKLLEADYAKNIVKDFADSLPTNKKFSSNEEAVTAGLLARDKINLQSSTLEYDEIQSKDRYFKLRDLVKEMYQSGNYNTKAIADLEYERNLARDEWQKAKSNAEAIKNLETANENLIVNKTHDWISELQIQLGNLTRPDLSNVQSMASIGANMGENDINVERQMNYWAKTIELQTTMKNLLDKIEQKENSATFN